MLIAIVLTVGISLAILLALLFAAGIFTWVERRLLGFVQERLGPNRVGPFGALQWFADTVKIMTKEDTPPPDADRFVFRFAPIIAAAPVLAGFAVVEFGEGLTFAPIDVGVIFILSMLGLTVHALILGAWASQSRYPLMGGLRAAAQLLGYEAFFGLSLLGVVMMAGSLSMTEIIKAQSNLWFIVTQPLGVLLFSSAAVASAHRLPFDLPESENDLVAGYMTEYSGMSFGLFYLGEYLGVMLVSALGVTLYLGGWNGPVLPGPVWFGLKTSVLCVVFIWVRATLPRPRYDQLVNFAWKFALPMALVNVLATGAYVVARAAP